LHSQKRESKVFGGEKRKESTLFSLIWKREGKRESTTASLDEEKKKGLGSLEGKRRKASIRYLSLFPERREKEGGGGGCQSPF